MSDFSTILANLLKSRVGSMSPTTDNSMANNFGAGPHAGQPSARMPNLLQSPYNPAGQYAPPVDMNKSGSLLGKGGGISGGGG